MSVRRQGFTDPIAVKRDDAVVCIPAAGTLLAGLQTTLSSVLRHGDLKTQVLVTVVADELLQLDGLFESTAQMQTLVVPDERWATGVDAVTKLAAPADIVVVEVGTQVGPQWLSRLRAAALSDSTVVSASALTSGGGALGVAAGDVSLSSEAAACAVAEAAVCARPRVSTPEPGAVYLRRSCLELAGGLGGSGRSASEVLTEFGARCLARGMLHVVADDVYVTLSDGQEAGERRSEPTFADDATLPERAAAVALSGEDERPEAGESAGASAVLRRCRHLAHMALDELSVTLDARALGMSLGGTQVYTIELALALARVRGLRLRVLVPPDPTPAAAEALGTLRGVELLTYEQAVHGNPARTDIVHRPQQAFTEHDLALLRLLGDRLVIGQQDLIGYRLPSYHESVEAWARYRRVTRLALAAADRVLFFSEHARQDAVGEDLVPAERAVRVEIGGDELWAREPAQPRPPSGGSDLKGFLLCLGADYRHKNRPFALRLLAALRSQHGWSGGLVLAGSHVALGSSREEERTLLGQLPELTEHVHDVGPVDEAERAWLMRRARAVVYPSLYEGYGLLPVEAARAGIPCLYAPQASLVESAGAQAATLVPWDAGASAAAVLPLLHESPGRDRHVVLLRGARRPTWSTIAEQLRAMYGEILASPWIGAPRLWEELDREHRFQQRTDDLRRLRDSVGALAAVSEGGLLTPAEQRGLMRVAARPWLRRAVLGPVGLVGRRTVRSEATPSD